MTAAATETIHPMVRRAEILEDNLPSTAFSNDDCNLSGQQSIEALDLVLAHWNMLASMLRSARLPGADGNAIDRALDGQGIHRGHPGVPRHLIETHVQGWLENCAPEPRSERQSAEPTASSDPGSTNCERTSRAAKEQPRNPALLEDLI